MVLDYGIHVNAENFTYRTMLKIAAAEGHEAVVHFLRMRADPLNRVRTLVNIVPVLLAAKPTLEYLTLTPCLLPASTLFLFSYPEERHQY